MRNLALHPRSPTLLSPLVPFLLCLPTSLKAGVWSPSGPFKHHWWSLLCLHPASASSLPRTPSTVAPHRYSAHGAPQAWALAQSQPLSAPGRLIAAMQTLLTV